MLPFLWVKGQKLSVSEKTETQKFHYSQFQLTDHVFQWLAVYEYLQLQSVFTGHIKLA